MDNLIKDQQEFMAEGQQEIYTHSPEQSELYKNLVKEEFTEFIDSIEDKEPRENQIKECLDLIVVCLGWLLSQGINVFVAWSLVHKNNMLKVINVKKDDEGKIIKSPEAIENKKQLMPRLRGLINGN